MWVFEEQQDKSSWWSTLAGQKTQWITVQSFISTILLCSSQKTAQIIQSNSNYYFTNQLWQPYSFNRNMLEFAWAIWVRNWMPWYKSKEKTHMLHGCQDYHWTPGHIGAVPLRSDRCCRCEWCRGIRFGRQKEPSPSPHNHGAGSQTPWSAKPRAPEAAPQSRSESCLTAWSQTAPQTERHFFSLTLFLDPALRLLPPPSGPPLTPA